MLRTIKIMILKLLLVPSLIAIISYLSTKKGQSIAGLLTGMPVIAGPITWFLYQDQGAQYALTSSYYSILGVLPLGLFCASYAALNNKLPLYLNIPMNMAIYIVIAFGFSQIPVTLLSHPIGVIIAFILVLVFLRCLIFFSQKRVKPIKMPSISKISIVIRMIIAIGFILALTSIALNLPASFIGALTTFPIAASTLAITVELQNSKQDARNCLIGIIQGNQYLLLFYFYIAIISIWFSFIYAFYIALFLLFTSLLFVRKVYIYKSNR